MPCPVCKLPFRTSHVGRCDLLSALAASDPNLLEDISVYGHDLPANYCIVDAALNRGKDIIGYKKGVLRHYWVQKDIIGYTPQCTSIDKQ